MIRHLMHISLVLILISPGISKAEIVEVRSMQSVKNHVLKLLEKYDSKDILVAFDIDLTLTQAAHPAMYYPAIKKHKQLHKQILADLTPAQKDLTLTLHVIQAKQMLVDPIHPEIVKQIQDIGCKTIALTATVTGNVQNVSGENIRIEHLRYRTLNDFGLNFSNTFPVNEIIFKDAATHNGNYPVFYNGILFSNGEKDETGRINKPSKGGVLISFLKHVQANPKVVIMVDDRKINLTDIEISLRKYNPDIHYLGYEYQGALDIAYEDVSAEDFKLFWEKLAAIAKCL